MSTAQTNEPSVYDRVIGDLQDGLADLTKALNGLTLSIATYKGDMDKNVALLQSEHQYIRRDFDALRRDYSQQSSKMSDRLFDLFKIALPWIAVGLVSYFNLHR